MDEPPSLNFLLSISTDLGLVYPAIHILLVAVLMLLLSAIVSASESAFFSINEIQLEQLRKDRNAQTAVNLLDQRRLLFATIRLLSATARIGLVTTFALILLGYSEIKLSAKLGIVCMTIVIALCVELIPKIYGKRSALNFVRMSSGTWNILVTICKPILVRFVKLKKENKTEFHEPGIGSEELNTAFVQSSEDKGTTAPREKEILLSIANFGKLTVIQVMRTRSEISAIDIFRNFTSLMKHVDTCGFSRIPVFRNSIDNIEGILYIKDLLPVLEHPEGFQWQSLIRPVLFVPENKKIDSLLKDFQEKRVHMAIVVDGQGKTIGLVTLEDLIEEIIGEINDEFDVDAVANRKEGETFLFDGKTSLQDFCAAVELDRRTLSRVSADSKNLSDFIISLTPGFSKAGDRINFEHLTFFVESVDRNGIKRVRVKVHEQA